MTPGKDDGGDWRQMAPSFQLDEKSTMSDFRLDHQGWLSTAVGPGIVIALLFVGFFKGAPFLDWVPVDLTAMSMGLVSVAVIGHLLISRGRARVSLWALAVVALALPAAFYPITNPAALDKRLRLIIPLVAVVGVCYLVRSQRQQHLWVWFHVALGVALVATGMNARDDAAVRFAGAGTNTIGAGRASGVAIVILLVVLMTGGIAKWWAKIASVTVTAWLATALISTGSRGPVFSCVTAVLLVATLSLGRHRYLRLMTALGSLAAGWMLLNEVTGVGATRITSTLAGEQSLSDGRSQLWSEAAHAAARNPLGIGWGNFWSVLPPAERLDSGYVQYPHNFLLEIYLEAGWLAGIGATVFVVASLIRLTRASDSPDGSALLGIAIFFVLNGSVSGDMNDNRMMWAALAIAWLRASPAKTSHIEQEQRMYPPILHYQSLNGRKSLRGHRRSDLVA